jgi:hypothetical protein
MAKSLFWLSEEAWRALSPHLPRGRPQAARPQTEELATTRYDRLARNYLSSLALAAIIIA